jgi:uncharacterized NAD-dependent epimerase/dehydratase family protein
MSGQLRQDLEQVAAAELDVVRAEYLGQPLQDFVIAALPRMVAAVVERAYGGSPAPIIGLRPPHDQFAEDWRQDAEAALEQGYRGT